MKHKALLVALGLSLLFNIFVLIGFTQARAEHGTDRRDNRMLERMVGELNLDEAQARAFAELQRTTRMHRSVFDESLALTQHDLMAELRSDSPDLERVRGLVAKRSELERERRMEGAQIYGQFVKVLSPEQRKGLSNRMLPGRQRPGPMMALRRFDANANGTLEPEELAAAQRQIDRRRREFSRRFDPSAPPHTRPAE